MLQGSLDTFDLGEVLAMLARKRQHGRLRLHSGPAAVDLYLNDGMIVHAESVDHGSSPRVAGTRAGLEEACFEILRWDHGSFEFQERVMSKSSRGLDATVDSVLEGARRRLEAWERVESVIPSMDVQPRLRKTLDVPEITITPDAWRVLAAIDGRRTVQALARVLGVSGYDLCQTLTNLVNLGLVEVNALPKVTIAAPGSNGGSPRPSIRLPAATRNGAGKPKPGDDAEPEDAEDN